MRALSVVLLLMSLVAVSGDAPRVERKLYVGTDSTEAILSFDSSLVVEAKRKPGKRKAYEHIEKQLIHLFGPMAEADAKAVPWATTN